MKYKGSINDPLDLVTKQWTETTISTQVSDMTGATSEQAGKHGLVPAPTTADVDKCLRGDGTWGKVDALPDQSQHSGQFLTTNGSEASWAPVNVSGAISEHNQDSSAHNDIRTSISGISGDVDTLSEKMTTAQENITIINSKIPTQAGPTNQLTDQNFVNSSIATNTAHYISDNGNPFSSLEALQAYSGAVTNNDYAFIYGTDQQGNYYFDRYKATVSGSTITWTREYRLNNSSFTAAQWAAISSGITDTLVTKLNGIEAGATAVSESTVSGWGFTKNTGNVIAANGTATRPVYISSTDVATPCTYGFGIDANGPYIESF